MLRSHDVVEVEPLQIKRDQIDERHGLDRIEGIYRRFPSESKASVDEFWCNDADADRWQITHRIPLSRVQLSSGCCEIEAQVFDRDASPSALRRECRNERSRWRRPLRHGARDGFRGCPLQEGISVELVFGEGDDSFAAPYMVAQEVRGTLEGSSVAGDRIAHV